MRRSDLEQALSEAPVLVAVPDSKAQEQLEELLKHPGLIHLYGLMLGAKQALFVALSHAPLTNMDTVSRAAVIQGTIAGIDMFYTTLLEQCPDHEEQKNG